MRVLSHEAWNKSANAYSCPILVLSDMIEVLLKRGGEGEEGGEEQGLCGIRGGEGEMKQREGDECGDLTLFCSLLFVILVFPQF